MTDSDSDSYSGLYTYDNPNFDSEKKQIGRKWLAKLHSLFLTNNKCVILPRKIRQFTDEFLWDWTMVFIDEIKERGYTLNSSSLKNCECSSLEFEIDLN